MRDDDPINQGLVMKEKEHPVNQDYGLAISGGASIYPLVTRIEADMEGTLGHPNVRMEMER
jgi:hypothetical protein